MAELATIARPYAEAAFALARDGGALPKWAETMSLLAAVVADPKVAGAVDNPKLSSTQKQSLFTTVLGDKLDAGTTQFVKVLLEADRVKLLPQINEHFQALKRDNDNVARATIVSAFPLTDPAGAKVFGWSWMRTASARMACTASASQASTASR